MKNIISKHLIRSICSGKIKSLIVIVSIAITSAVFYLNLNIHDDMVENTIKAYRSSAYGFDIMISGSDLRDNTVIPSDEGVIFIEKSEGMTQLSAGQKPFETTVCKSNLSLLADFSLISNADGNLPLRNHEAVISSFNSRNFNLNQGDKVRVWFDESSNEEYTIALVADSLGLFNDYNTDNLELLVQEYDAAPNLCFVRLADDGNIDSSCEMIKNNNPSLDVSSLYDGSGEGKTYNNIKDILLVVLVFVFVCSVFVIGSTVRLIVESRIPDMAIFRSIGASQGKVRFLLKCESTVYGLAGGILGTVAGEFLRIYLRTHFFELEAGTIRFVYTFAVPVFAVVLSLCVSSYYIDKSSKKSIRSLLFESQSTASVYPGRLGFAGVVLFAVSCFLEYFNKEYRILILIIALVSAIAGVYLFAGTFSVFVSNLFSRLFRRKNTPCLWLACRNNALSKINRNSSILVAMVVSLLIAIYITITSLTAFFDRYEDNYPCSLMIKGLEQPSGVYSDICTVEGISKVKYEYWKYSSNQYINGEKQKLCFVSQDGFSNGIEYPGRETALLEEGHLIVDRLLADRNGWKTGDFVEIKGTYEISGIIDGFCDSSIFNSKRTTVLMSHESYLNLVCENPSIMGIIINADKNRVIVELNNYLNEKQEIRAKIYDVQDYVGREFANAMNALHLASAVPVLIAVLVVFGLVNNQLISFAQKKRIYAVLYSTSMSRAYLAKMIVWELAGIFANGCIMGSLLGLRLSKMLRDLIYISVAYIPLEISAENFILPAVFMFAALCATLIFPISQLKKMSIIKEIQYE